jgi:endoribonuclease Dicer
MSVDNGKYYCEVVMPEHAPIRSAFGLRYPRKALAKRSAAFGMCIKLLEGKFLDSLLLSSMKKTKPEGANAHLAVNGKKTGMYVMLVKPSLWADGRGLIPETVYLTIIDMPKGLDRSHQPIGLLTRHALPQLPSFLLFLNSGKISNVQTSPTPGFNVSADEIEAFNTYTLLLWNHVNAKVFENNAANMSYWVVPILGQWAAMTTGRDCIDWAAVKYAVLRKGQQWTPKMPKELLENKFMIDPWAGNRRFFSVRVEPDLKPLDAIPEETAKFNRPGANKKKNILQYSISLFGKKFDEEWPKWDKEQPVMECTQVMHRQNLLAPPTPEEKDVNIGFRKAFLCPEPLVISGVSMQ